VPLFKKQIERGGPITITHPEMVRYFMTIPEAAQLVIQAAAIGKGGEIFLLDMGAAVKIVDLARDMISLSGSDEDEIRIEYTGLQPGEKLAEELFSAEEAKVRTSHPKVCCVVGRTAVLEDVERLFEQLKTLPGEPPDLIRECLRRIVPEYRSSSLCGPESPVVGGRGGDKSGAITERSARVG
jgi:FlaA1/EpsC-like NDP-sugar epimerase